MYFSVLKVAVVVPMHCKPCFIDTYIHRKTQKNIQSVFIKNPGVKGDVLFLLWIPLGVASTLALVVASHSLGCIVGRSQTCRDVLLGHA